MKPRASRLSVARRVVPSDLETPVSAYMKAKRAFPNKPAFLFESVERGEQVGRYSILGFDTETAALWNGDSGLNPLRILEKGMKDFSGRVDSELPFPCGGFGYLGYDAVHVFEKIPTSRRGRGSHFPGAWFVIPRRMILFDHVRNVMTLLVIEPKKDCEKTLSFLEKALLKPLDKVETRRASRAGKYGSSETKESFMKMVVKAKEEIRAGEIFQVVLSQQLAGKTGAGAIDVYRALRILNPSPYMYFLDFGDFQVIGSSPEMLVKVTGETAETRPIAGTRPRGKSDAEDGELAVQLLADPKERAEHIMLVDLGRNDLGRVCEYGSVHVKGYMEIERYSHVMHLVSTVQGKVRSGKTSMEVLQSAFPAGTVSGAPKVRAMEIIEELESAPRGPYAGCVGYVGFAGNLDTCITIRTILMKGREVRLQAGAGIVADSDPESEYRETLSKVEGMKQAIRIAENGLKI